VIKNEDEKQNGVRARLCTAEDFDINNSTKRFYQKYTKFIVLCPTQENLYLHNSFDDPNYLRRFDF
jgi:hypothetical protein